jgi:hypothetical protein
MAINSFTANAKPQALKVQPENIPESLKQLNRWVVWGYQQPKGNNKKWRKVPMSSNGGSGRVNDSSTWATFEKVLSVYQNGVADGIGFVLGNDLHGIDLDNCRDPLTGELNQLANEVLLRIQGYAEVSPSGTGIKLIARTNLIKSNKNVQIELYNGQRYFCLTGHDIATHNEVSPIEQDVKWLADRISPNSQAEAEHQHDAFASLKLPLPDWPLSRVKSDLLPHLDCEFRSSWLEVGHALHHQGDGDYDWFETWSMWSDQSSKFVEGECESIWAKMNREKSSGKSVVTLATLIARAAQAKRSSRKAFGTGSNEALRVYNISELMALPPQTWLVKGVIPQTGMGIVYGDSGSGKTFITIDLTLSIARGLSWQTCRVKQPIGVLYVSAEGGGAMGARLQAYAKHHDTDLSALPFGVVTVGLNLRGGDDQKVIDGCYEMRSRGVPIGLIVLDTLNRTMGGGDENSSQDMGAYLDAVARVVEKTGAFVLVVHHSGKDAKKGARGHSSLRAAVDTELEVKAEGATQILKVTKSRDGLTGIEYAYKREVIVVATDDELEPITSCVAIPLGSLDFVGRKRKPSGRWQELACGALQKLGGVALKMAVLEEVGNIVQHRNRWRDSASRGIQACIDVGIFDSNGDQLKFS